MKLWTSLLFFVAALASACASGPSTLPTGTSRDPRTLGAKPPEPPKIDYARLGRPVKLGATIELLGSEAVWLEGEPLIVTLEQTMWDDVMGARAGRAKLRFMQDGKDTALTIPEGGSKVAFGYTVTVTLAHETYNKARGTTVPQCKLTVTK
jgi:hypothetical protein